MPDSDRVVPRARGGGGDRQVKRREVRVQDGLRRRLLGDEVLSRIGGYVAGNLLISLIAGVTSYVYLMIAGVPLGRSISVGWLPRS